MLSLLPWVVATMSDNDQDTRAILETLTYFNNIAGAAQQRRLKNARQQSAPVM